MNPDGRFRNEPLSIRLIGYGLALIGIPSILFILGWLYIWGGIAPLVAAITLGIGSMRGLLVKESTAKYAKGITALVATIFLASMILRMVLGSIPPTIYLNEKGNLCSSAYPPESIQTGDSPVWWRCERIAFGAEVRALIQDSHKGMVVVLVINAWMPYIALFIPDAAITFFAYLSLFIIDPRKFCRGLHVMMRAMRRGCCLRGAG